MMSRGIFFYVATHAHTLTRICLCIHTHLHYTHRNAFIFIVYLFGLSLQTNEEQKKQKQKFSYSIRNGNLYICMVMAYSLFSVGLYRWLNKINPSLPQIPRTTRVVKCVHFCLYGAMREFIVVFVMVFLFIT